MLRTDELLRRLERWPRWRAYALLVGLTLAVGYSEYLTGDRFSLSILYFPVVALCCWLVGLRPAIVLSLVASTLWILDDYLVPPAPLPDYLKAWHCLTRFVVFTAFAWVLSRLRVALAREHRLSHFDELTGLANRASLFEYGQRDVAHCRRAGRPITAVFIDLDEFKQVNDRCGHAEGDRVLRAAAKCVRENTRAGDLTARLGGDEFVVLAPEMNREIAEHFTARLQDCLRQRMYSGGWPVTFSMGAATFARPPASLDEIVKAADDLMYEVKHRRKNGVLLRQIDAAVEVANDVPELELAGT